MADKSRPPRPDARLVRREWDAGDHIVVEVQTAAEALDRNGRLAERAAAYSADVPDDMLVAEDGRPVAVHYTAAARRVIDARLARGS